MLGEDAIKSRLTARAVPAEEWQDRRKADL
jgi:hypothetical protein